MPRCTGVSARTPPRTARRPARRRGLRRRPVHRRHGEPSRRSCGSSTSPARAPTASTSTRCPETSWWPTPFITSGRSPSTSWPPRSCCAAASSPRIGRCAATCGRRRCTTTRSRRPRTLRDARVGFVGFGHIGQFAWELFRAFGSAGAAVTGSGRVDAAAHGLSWAGDIARLDDLMRESDVVVVSAPLTPATEGMIGAAQLRALGPGRRADQRRPRATGRRTGAVRRARATVTSAPRRSTSGTATRRAPASRRPERRCRSANCPTS